MASPSVSLGTGALFAFSGFVADGGSFRFVGVERAMPDVTKLIENPYGVDELGSMVFAEHEFGGQPSVAKPGTAFGRRKFLQGTAKDPGRIEGTFHLNPDTLLPVTGTADSFTATWPGGAIWAGSGYWMSFEMANIDIDGVMTLNGVFKISGAITVTAAP
jgi:hypothetical protein